MLKRAHENDGKAADCRSQQCDHAFKALVLGVSSCHLFWVCVDEDASVIVAGGAKESGKSF
jgi:hypothetical protein